MVFPLFVAFTTYLLANGEFLRRRYMMKQCIRCGQLKDESEFPFNRYGVKTCRRNTCRECYSALRKNHEDDDKPDGLTCKKCGEYQPITGFTKNRQCLYGVEPVCKACKRQRRREYIRLYPERARNADLKYQYGITIEQYHAMYDARRAADAPSAAQLRRSSSSTTTTRRAKSANSMSPLQRHDWLRARRYRHPRQRSRVSLS